MLHRNLALRLAILRNLALQLRNLAIQLIVALFLLLATAHASEFKAEQKLGQLLFTDLNLSLHHNQSCSTSSDQE